MMQLYNSFLFIILLMLKLSNMFWDSIVESPQIYWGSKNLFPLNTKAEKVSWNYKKVNHKDFQTWLDNNVPSNFTWNFELKRIPLITADYNNASRFEKLVNSTYGNNWSHVQIIQNEYSHDYQFIVSYKNTPIPKPIDNSIACVYHCIEWDLVEVWVKEIELSDYKWIVPARIVQSAEIHHNNFDEVKILDVYNQPILTNSVKKCYKEIVESPKEIFKKEYLPTRERLENIETFKNKSPLDDPILVGKLNVHGKDTYYIIDYRFSDIPEEKILWMQQVLIP